MAEGAWHFTDAGAPGSCPKNATFELPRHAKENLDLAAALHRARPPAAAAWLRLSGAGPSQGRLGMVKIGCEKEPQDRFNAA